MPRTTQLLLVALPGPWAPFLFSPGVAVVSCCCYSLGHISVLLALSNTTACYHQFRELNVLCCKYFKWLWCTSLDFKICVVSYKLLYPTEAENAHTLKQLNIWHLLGYHIPYQGKWQAKEKAGIWFLLSVSDSLKHMDCNTEISITCL